MQKKRVRKYKLKSNSVVYLFRLAVLALTIMFIFSGISFLFERSKMIRKRNELEAKIAEQERLTVLYEEELSRVGTKEYYEYMARKNLGYVYPDEYVMVIIDENKEE